MDPRQNQTPQPVAGQQQPLREGYNGGSMGYQQGTCTFPRPPPARVYCSPSVFSSPSMKYLPVTSHAYGRSTTWQ